MSSSVFGSVYRFGKANETDCQLIVAFRRLRFETQGAIRHLLGFLEDKEVLSLDGMPTPDQIVANDPEAPGGGRYFGAGEHLFQ